MPLYDYRCEKCGEEFEQLVSSSKKNAAAKCPKCDSTRTSRQFSSFTGTCNVVSAKPSCANSAACPTGACPFANN